ncbi:MAG: GyrI-like domain-containing protein [Anaerolineales bacterium]|nr:GyrI-like domain-containing protein [Anaerolineales bacterium]
MKKIDLKKELKELYRPGTKKVSVVTVPPMNYLMINGKGDPNTAQEYREAVEVLYPLAYALKFMLKRGEAQLDYVVMPLEGLWWAEDMTTFSMERKDEWLWTAMIMQPPEITQEIVDEAAEQVRKKKNPPALDKVRFAAFDEGAVVQIMHIGPYADEAPNIARLHQFITDNGYTRRGKHHEIYLSDPGRVTPEKLKTVIRQPFAIENQGVERR